MVGNPVLPPAHNVRSPEMWVLIRTALDHAGIDLTGMVVADYGCGGGDIMARAKLAGAHKVYGYEADPEIAQATSYRLKDISGTYVINVPLDDFTVKWPGSCDLQICTSVLPYLKDPFEFLKWMVQQKTPTIIETQYAGDGPGFGHIKNDGDMFEWLISAGFKECINLGATYIPERDKARTIWLCT